MLFRQEQLKGTVTRFCACTASWFLIWRKFFQDWLLVKKSSSIYPETPEKAIISEFNARAIWSILEVLNAIFCIFVQAVSRKFEVIEEKCTKPCSLLSRGGGVLPYITNTGMCRPTGSWFWSYWFRTGYPFQSRFLERGIIFETHESSSFASSHLKLFKDRLLLKLGVIGA